MIIKEAMNSWFSQLIAKQGHNSRILFETINSVIGALLSKSADSSPERCEEGLLLQAYCKLHTLHTSSVETFINGCIHTYLCFRYGIQYSIYCIFYHSLTCCDAALLGAVTLWGAWCGQGRCCLVIWRGYNQSLIIKPLVFVIFVFII